MIGPTELLHHTPVPHFDTFHYFWSKIKYWSLNTSADVLYNINLISLIKKNPTKCKNVSKFYYSIFIWSSTLDVVRNSTMPDNVHQLHVWKTRGCQCSFRLLMVGGVSPETCWASYKYRKIKFWYTVASFWIFLYELYYDARIHKHQI